MCMQVGRYIVCPQQIVLPMCSPNSDHLPQLHPPTRTAGTYIPLMTCMYVYNKRFGKTGDSDVEPLCQGLKQAGAHPCLNVAD